VLAARHRADAPDHRQPRACARPIPRVVTVGYIAGGTKNNIIPDEVKLGLTVRSYADDTRVHLIAAIRRICRGEAIAAGLPDNLMPRGPRSTPPRGRQLPSTTIPP